MGEGGSGLGGGERTLPLRCPSPFSPGLELRRRFLGHFSLTLGKGPH